MENHSLIERIKSKDSEKALKEIYQSYQKEFLHWAVNHRSCTFEEAKDIFQQSVIILYENIIQDRVSEFTVKVKTYLFSIAKNKLNEIMRQKDRSEMYFNDLTYNNDLFYNTVDNEFDEQLKAIEFHLKEMGDPCKGILELYYYHKKSMTEISLALEYKNSDTVKNLKYKCLQRLRQMCKSELASFVK